MRRNSIPEREIDAEDTVTAELQVNLRKLSALLPPSSSSSRPTSLLLNEDRARGLLIAEASEDEVLLEDVLREEDEEEGVLRTQAEDEEVREAFRGWRQVEISTPDQTREEVAVMNKNYSIILHVYISAWNFIKIQPREADIIFKKFAGGKIFLSHYILVNFDTYVGIYLLVAEYEEN